MHCKGCGCQASVTAGTVFHGTRSPLRLWFQAMWWVTAQKNGASALGLQRILGLGSYETAWTWLHKLRRAMVRPGRDLLSGEVEVMRLSSEGSRKGVPIASTVTCPLHARRRPPRLGLPPARRPPGAKRMRPHARVPRPRDARRPPRGRRVVVRSHLEGDHRPGVPEDRIATVVLPLWTSCARCWCAIVRPRRIVRVPESVLARTSVGKSCAASMESQQFRCSGRGLCRSSVHRRPLPGDEAAPALAAGLRIRLSTIRARRCRQRRLLQRRRTGGRRVPADDARPERA
jgi:hypothetical protein